MAIVQKYWSTWNELEEVLLDVEVALNNRPLSYLEDDAQLPVFDSMCHDVRSTKSCPRRKHRIRGC